MQSNSILIVPRHRLAAATSVVVVVVGVLVMTAAPVAAKPSKGAVPTGYDLSYPQCGRSYPTSVTFGIVGVNDGIVFSANPCAASELAWAGAAQNRAPAFYANTADPGPAYSSHWPTGEQSPEVCDGSNSSACSYDYGWNGAQNSFAVAVAAEQADGSASPTTTAAAAPWWLDVETGNSWETLEPAYGATAPSDANDQADLQGAVAYLASKGVGTVGFYSTGSQWTSILGGTGSRFVASPDWVAGFRTLSLAQAGCSSTSFTGGRVALTQYPSGVFDGDYACP
jgi:hypothetical protein